MGTPALCSPLNKKVKPGKYGVTTSDGIQEAQKKAEGVESEATTEAATAKDDTHERDGDTKSQGKESIYYTNPLPEHYPLRGLPFARELKNDWKKPPPEHMSPAWAASTPTVAPAAVPAAKRAVVEQAQTESLADPETQREAPAESPEEEEQKKGGDEEARQKEERKKREAEEARLRQEERRKALLRDPPFFRDGWFDNSKYELEEGQVLRYGVQDEGIIVINNTALYWHPNYLFILIPLTH